MNNPKKVIDGLRSCIEQNRHECRGCLYRMQGGGYRSCIRNLMIDALETVESLQRESERAAGKKILDVTCGSRSIWFDKHHPSAVYMDKREEHATSIWKSGDGLSERVLNVEPDIVGDFTAIPFPDETFRLVVFDPPHLLNVGNTAWITKKYGKLDENWPQMLHDGFAECMRVLKPDGVLIFKWSESDIPAADVWKAIGERPLFGHHSGKNSKTFWASFMKEAKTLT